MDMSMIFRPVYADEQFDTNIVNETVMLATKNITLKNRGGRKMITIQPTHREPFFINGVSILHEFHMPKNTNANVLYTMKDIMQPNQN